jgi:Cytochrome c7 and related cytochrome c
MAQLFSPRADIVMRTVVATAGAIVVALPLAVWAFARTPAATGQYRTYQQPIPFAHSLHVNGLQIDCRYCHAGVERTAMAGLPPTQTCVPCHQDTLIEANVFAPVRQSLATGRPIPWRRVNRLADFVFFNHAVHVRNGVDCDTCHGPVGFMQEVYQAAPLTMEWCLQCHRAPDRYIALRQTAAPGWKRGDQDRSRTIAAEHDVQRLTSCTTCHR